MYKRQDDEVPLAGEVSGITVMDIDGGDHGLVEYNKPAGFVGGIAIKKLMARITFRYKLEVENYKSREEYRYGYLCHV